MAILQLSVGSLHVRLSRFEKIGGLLRDAEFPLSTIASAEAVAEPLTAMRGIRAPGLGLPGLRRIGTWRAVGERTMVCVRRGQPAVRVRLRGQRFDTLLIGSDDAAALAAELTAAGHPRA